jgi:hypothetical protein
MLTLKRVLGIGVSWALVWLVCWTLVAAVSGAVDPDSIDPGEGWMFFLVFGPMGVLTGIVFGALLSWRRQPGAPGAAGPALIVVVGNGLLATALVQVLYLGHGDQGLFANVMMALLFTAIGGAVTAAWLPAERWWLGRALRRAQN